VLAVAEKASSDNGVGTTLAAAAIVDDALHWIAAGDSRIYILRGSYLTRVTADHIYAKELNEQLAAGKISRCEAQSHSERAFLTSHLGQQNIREVDKNVRDFPLQPGDCVILCTDGLYRALSETEIVEAYQGDLQSACDSWVIQALEKKRAHQDNLTVIALRRIATRRSQGVWRAARAPLIGIIAGLFLIAVPAGLEILSFRFQEAQANKVAADQELEGAKKKPKAVVHAQEATDDEAHQQVKDGQEKATREGSETGSLKTAQAGAPASGRTKKRHKPGQPAAANKLDGGDAHGKPASGPDNPSEISTPPPNSPDEQPDVPPQTQPR
jgi:hypothetical protein